MLLKELLKKVNFEMKSADDNNSMNYLFAVGYTTKDEDYLKFLFEGSPDFSVVPSFAVIPAQAASFGMFTGGIPGLNIDPTKVLLNELLSSSFSCCFIILFLFSWLHESIFDF